MVFREVGFDLCVCREREKEREIEYRDSVADALEGGFDIFDVLHLFKGLGFRVWALGLRD